MRKSFILSVVLIGVFAGMAAANQLGFGYNNGGPTLRFKWDDNIVSELSVMINYNNQKANTSPSYITASNDMTFVISPISLTLYKGQMGEVNVGFKLKDLMHYEEGIISGVRYNTFTANNYGLDIMLPELELSVPGVDGLKLIGSVGISSSWNYDSNGKLQAFNMGIYGVSLANIGIVYYFNIGGAQSQPVKSENAGGNTAK
jgi:hypothetical protein